MKPNLLFPETSLDKVLNHFEKLGFQRWAMPDSLFEMKVQFPYMDIETTKDSVTYKIQLAGYGKENIEAFVRNSTLFVNADIADQIEDGVDKLTNNIAARSVKAKYPLICGDNYTDVETSYEDGILAVKFLLGSSDNKFKLEIK